MSQQIANVNLAGAIVGTTGTVSWGKLLTPPTIEQQMRPGQTSAATLLIHNESAAQLLLTFPDTGRTVSFPAGKWAALQVRANEQSVTYSVTAIAPNPLFKSFLVDFYWPGEPVDPMGTLGNSPIGGPTTSVTQVIQDGQPAGQTLAESTPTGLAYSTVLLSTAGRLDLEQDTAGSPHFVRMISGNAPTFFFDQYIDHATGSYGLFDGKNSKNIIFAINPLFHTDLNLETSGTLTVFQAVASVGGQATGGSFGVPLIVAQALNVAVAVTGDQTILSYAPSATGLYQINGHASWSNGSNSNVTFRVTYADPNLGTPTAWFNQGLTQLNAASFLAGTLSMWTNPITIYAATGTNIIVHWNDAAGTPNDHVSAQIVRLA